MKIKFLIPIIFSIIIGFLLGQVFFTEYSNEVLTVFNEGENVYFIQAGVYNNLESIDNSIKNNNNYLVEQEKDGYHIYVGITKNEKTAEKIKGIYENKGNNIYIKQKKLTNNSFLSILSEYDKITMIASNDDDLLSVEKIVLSNYKEMVLQDESND